MEFTDEQLYEEILLSLYNDKKYRQELALEVIFTDFPDFLYSHATLKRINRHDKYVVFKDVNEAIRYVKCICWHECKKC